MACVITAFPTGLSAVEALWRPKSSLLIYVESAAACGLSLSLSASLALWGLGRAKHWDSECPLFYVTFGSFGSGFPFLPDSQAWTKSMGLLWGVQIGVCHSEFEFLHLLCEKNNIHPIIIIRAVRHLALRSEASKPTQIGTEPSLFIFQTSPSSLIATFLASSLLWQGCILKLRERWKFPERCLSLFTVSRRPLRCRQWVELPGSQVCVIVSVCTPLLMLPLWAPLLPSRVKSSPNVHLLWAHVVIMCSFSEDLEGQRQAKRQKGSSRQGWWAPWCCAVQILSTMYELCDRRTWSSLQGSVCKEE